MKIIINIPVWKRPEVFDLVMTRLNEIRDWSKNEIIIRCVGDPEDKARTVFEAHAQKNDEYLIHKNKPVSNKINHLFETLKDTDFDYAITGASDDLVSDRGWRLLETEMEKEEYHFIGVYDINFFKFKTNQAGYYKFSGRTINRTIGCYRCLHYNLLKSMDFKPFYDNMNTGIDWTMEQQLQVKLNMKQKVIELGNTGDIVDVKSSTNIHSFEKLKRLYKFADVNNFPPEIKKLIL